MLPTRPATVRSGDAENPRAAPRGSAGTAGFEGADASSPSARSRAAKRGAHGTSRAACWGHDCAAMVRGWPASGRSRHARIHPEGREDTRRSGCRLARGSSQPARNRGRKAVRAGDRGEKAAFRLQKSSPSARVGEPPLESPIALATACVRMRQPASVLDGKLGAWRCDGRGGDGSSSASGLGC